MTRKKLRATIFTVGEEINPEFHNLRLRITAIHSDTNIVEAVVIKAEGFFSEDHSTPGWHQTGFKQGMELIFKPSGMGDWNPEDKAGVAKNLPWFSLTTHKGEKRFAHYR